MGFPALLKMMIHACVSSDAIFLVNLQNKVSLLTLDLKTVPKNKEKEISIDKQNKSNRQNGHAHSRNLIFHCSFLSSY